MLLLFLCVEVTISAADIYCRSANQPLLGGCTVVLPVDVLCALCLWSCMNGASRHGRRVVHTCWLGAFLVGLVARVPCWCYTQGCVGHEKGRSLRLMRQQNINYIRLPVLSACVPPDSHENTFCVLNPLAAAGLSGTLASPFDPHVKCPSFWTPADHTTPNSLSKIPVKCPPGIFGGTFDRHFRGGLGSVVRTIPITALET